MPTPLPEDLFRIDKAKLMQLRDNPDALNAFVDDLTKSLISPFKTALAAGKQATPPLPKVAPAPPVELNQMFPVEPFAVPIRDPEPVASPTPIAPAPPLSKQSSPAAPVGPTHLIDRVLDDGVKVVHTVDHSVVHRAPVSTPVAAPVVLDVAVPKKEVVSEPLAPQVQPEKVSEPINNGAQSKDVSESERRRLERETQLSGLLKKDQGELL